MKAVILAGGRGSRITEESHLRPKPMIEIGGKPILWHVMKLYSHFGINDFIICLGYRGYMIKEYFVNYFLHQADITVDIRANAVEFHNSRSEPWRVTLVDTGEHTLTGGRVLRVRSHLDPAEAFLLTYGDGLADLDVAGEVAFHKAHGHLATMTVVRPPARFGAAGLSGDMVASFEEKPQADGGVINGGFFVLEPGVLDLIEGDETPFETTPLIKLVEMGELAAWRHDGFWQSMDTLRERELLEAYWTAGEAPWKLWR